MMNEAQIKNVTFLYTRFLESEAGWAELDNYLELLENLDDDQLFRESSVLYSIHKTKAMGCNRPHKPESTCLVTSILEAVESIIDLYKETGNLHPKNRYLLCYYLALSQDGQIIELIGL